jgi:uncharacterized protein (DUF433 family)
MRWQDYIERRPDLMGGKPVFKGTRLTVEHVLERLGSGSTEADLLAAHQRLRPEHIRAAQSYAAAALASDEMVYLAEKS